MTSIDERVVRLVFDNQKFADKIKDTLSMLENLKKNLNLSKATDSFNSIEKAANKVDLSPLSNSVEEISDRFSTFGIVGVTAIANITTYAMNAAKNLTSALISPIVEGGKRRALNIEKAKFQIEGLGYAWEEVEKDISYGVNDTAYGLDAAAVVAGQLLASNVKVGDSMKTALRGISGVAAMTQSSYEDIGKIFTTVAGNGKLMGDQLMQLSARGINAAATLGKALGKSEAEIRTMVSKGQIDFATFAKAMDDAFGEHAKQANNTFTGALSNMKAALSRIGAAFATPAYENLRKVILSLTTIFKAFLTSLTPVIDLAKEGMEAVTTFITGTLDNIDFKQVFTEPLQQAANVFRHLGKVVMSVGTAISKVIVPFGQIFSEVFGDTVYNFVIKLAEGLEWFFDRLIIRESMVENQAKTFRGFLTILQSIVEVLLNMASAIGGVLSKVFVNTFGLLWEYLLDITGFLGDFSLRIKKFVDDLLELQTVKDLIEAISSILGMFGQKASDAYEPFREFTSGLLSSALNLVLSVLDKLLNILLDIFKVADNVIQKVKEFVKAFIELPVVQGTISAIRDLFEALKNTAIYLASVIGEKLSSAFGTIIDMTSKAADVVSDLILAFLDLPAVKGLTDKITKSFDRLRESIEWVTPIIQEHLVDAFESLMSIISKVIRKIRDLVAGQMPKIEAVASKVREAFEGLKRVAEWLAPIIKDRVVTAFNNFVSTASRVIKAARDIFDEYVKLPSLEEALSNFQNFVTEMFENGATAMDVAKEVIGQIVDRVKEITQMSFEKILGQLGSLREKILNVVDAIGQLFKGADVLGSISNGFKAFSGSTGEILTKVKEKLNTFIQWTESRFASIKMGDIIAAGAGASLFAFMMSFTRLTNEMGNLAKTATGFLGSFSKITGGIASLIKDVDSLVKNEIKNRQMERISEIIKAVALLAASVAVLAAMDQQKVIASAAVIGILTTAIIGLSFAANNMSKVVNEGEVIKSTTSIAAVAGSILILALALKTISSINSDQLATGLIGITVLMAELTAFMVLMGKVSNPMTEGSKIVAINALALILMANALKNISEIDTGGLVKAMLVVGALIAFLTFAGSIGQKSELKSALGIVGVAVAMKLIIGSLSEIARIDADAYSTGIRRMIELIGSVMLLCVATALAGKHAKKAAYYIVGVALAINLIAIGIKNLASIDNGMLDQATTVIEKIMIVMSLIVVATKVVGSEAHKAAVTLVGVGGALILIAGAMAIMAKIDPEGLDRAVQAVTRIMLLFSLIIAATSVVQEAHKTLTTMTICISALLGIMAVLSLIEPDNITAASKAITMVIASFSALMLMSNFAGEATASMAIMLAIVAGLGVMLKVLSSGDWQGAVSSAVSLSILIATLTAVTIALQFVDPEAALFGIAGFAIVVAGLGTLMAALGALVTYIPDLKTLVSTAIPLLEEIGRGLGAFFGGIAGGVLDAAGKSLVPFANNLTIFVESFSNFANSISQINPSVIDSLGRLVSFVAILAGADFLEGLNIFGTKGAAMRALSENLPVLGEAVSGFADSVDPSKVERISSLSGAMKNFGEMMASLPTEGGLISIFTGEVDFDRFKDSLPKFGEALSKFGDSVKGLNRGNIEDSIEPARSIVELCNSIANSGGLISMITGDWAGGMEKLQENLYSFGSAMKDYGKAVSGMNVDKINDSIGPARSVIEICTSIQSAGGALSYIMGDFGGGMKSLSDNLRGFGKGLAGYSKELYGVRMDQVKESIEPVKALVEIFNSLNAEQGVINWFAGSTDVASKGFIENVKKLGESIKEFAKQTNDMPTDKIGVAMEITNSILDIMKMIKDEGGEDLTDTLAKFNGNIFGLGIALNQFGEQTSGMKSDGVDQAVRVAEGLIGAMTAMISGAGENLKFAADAESMWMTLANTAGGMGTALKEFADNVSGIDGNGIDDAIKVAKGLAEFMNSLTESGGTGEFLTGSKLNSFKAISENAESLGKGISAFATSISGIGGQGIDSAIDNALKIAKSLGEMFNSMDPDEVNGGRKKGMQDLSDTLGGFGEALSSFATSITEGNIDLAKVNQVVDISRAIKDSFDSLNGITFDDMYNGLVKFAAGYKTLSESLASVNFDNVQSAVYWFNELKNVNVSIGQMDTHSLDQLIEALKQMGQMSLDGLNAIFVSHKDTLANSMYDVIANALYNGLNAFSDRMGDFAQAGNDILDQVASGMNPDGDNPISIGISSVIDDIKNRFSESEGFESCGETVSTKVANGIGNQVSVGQVIASIKNIMSQAKIMADSQTEQFRIVGATISSKIGDGIRRNVSAITGAINSIMDSAARVISNNQAFYEIGRNASQGLANGIIAGQQTVINASTAVGNASGKAFKAAFKEASPSKVTRAIGRFASMGLALGITDLKDRVVKDSTSVANGAIDSMSETLSNMSQNLSSDSDYSPTITPVLDLSEVEKGMGRIGQMTEDSTINVQGSYNNLGLAFDSLSRTNNVASLMMSKLDGLISNIQNGTKSQDTIININGARINDDDAMRNATKNYLIELQRLGAM